jgi:glucan phosphoethanolaminetransferase (alkaline phosphatase superfamily)
MNIGFLPLMSSIISFIFAVTVLDQYFARRKAYQLVWAIGLFMYSVSTFTEFWTETYGLNETIYRLWYLFGAIYVAAYLGLGTAYLLAKRRTANIILIVLLIGSIYAVVKVFTASVDLSVITSLTGKAMPQDVRLITPFFNTFGTLLLVGGALYCAWIYWKKRILPHRVISNVLIAFGAILPAIGGGMIRFIGTLNVFYLLELLGIIIIFAGFLQTKEVFGFYRFPLIHGFAKVTNSRKSK